MLNFSRSLPFLCGFNSFTMVSEISHLLLTFCLLIQSTHSNWSKFILKTIKTVCLEMEIQLHQHLSDTATGAVTTKNCSISAHTKMFILYYCCIIIITETKFTNKYKFMANIYWRHLLLEILFLCTFERTADLMGGCFQWIFVYGN